MESTNIVKFVGHVTSFTSKNFNSWRTVTVTSKKEFPNSVRYYSQYTGMVSGDNLHNIPKDRDIEFTCKVSGKFLNCINWNPCKLKDCGQIKKFLCAKLNEEHYKKHGFRLITRSGIEELVNEFGDSTMDLFENKDTNKLMPHFGDANKVLAACKLINTLDAEDEFFKFMSTHEISRTKAQKIWNEFREDSLEVVRSNPFICMEIDGIGFKTCDEIAKSLNTALDSKERVLAGSRYAIEQLTESTGDTAVDLGIAIDKTIKLLQVDGDEVVNKRKWVSIIQSEISENRSFVIYNGKIMTVKDSENERKSSLKICTMLNCGEGMPSAYPMAEAINNSKAIKLVASQMAAVKICLESPVSVLTGGPGTGKTTVVKTIVEAYKRTCSFPVTCMAPTGKAASRMSEATGENAHTIHKTLNIIPGMDKSKVTVLPCGLVIIDELSMIDQDTMAKLMTAMPTRGQIIFVGDINQLPSVGKGDVLNQLIKSGVVPVARLTETFRQKKGSLIVDNAYKVNNGDINLEYDKESFEFYRLADNSTDIERFKKFYNYKIGQYGVENVMILCPRRRIPEGKELFFVADKLNVILQDVANPASADKPEAKLKDSHGDRKFRLGDRVMQWKNKADSSNGDIGKIVDIKAIGNEVFFTIEWEVDKTVSNYNFSDMESITLAYCMSIHKSQGSEAQCVIMPFMREHKSPLFQRNLLYTGITRAKKECIIVGDKESVDTCIKTAVTGTRTSFLKERLQMRSKEFNKAK